MRCCQNIFGMSQSRKSEFGGGSICVEYLFSFAQMTVKII